MTESTMSAAPRGLALRPEQERALDYARRRGTESTVEEIRGRVRATYAAVDELVAGVPAQAAALRPGPASWSVREVVDHLVQSDRPAAAQLEQLLRGEDVEAPIPASLLSADPLAAGWDSVRQELRNVHAHVLRLLDGAPNDTPLTATAPVEMVVKCADVAGSLRPVHWVERFDWKAYAILLHAHNREHLAQLQRILAVVTTSGG